MYQGAKLNASSKPLVDVVVPVKNSTSHSDLKRGLKQISLNNSGQLESKSKVVSIFFIKLAVLYCDRFVSEEFGFHLDES